MDASIVVDAITPSRRSAAARALLADYDEWVAPALIDAEVISALARLERAGQISEKIAGEAVADWARLNVERVDGAALVLGAWRLRKAVSSTDAFYVALAQSLNCPLIASDRRLARAPIRGISTISPV
ncbi:type II toxin-antitoxin system VapC family toxin [Gryllotalpicola protaetiae]|uniref:type II toxin-antitoxin system VapC family toxin n=1 Tax=Gryllotalpicola protaetiae TaxID=2419771 RepID=UPI0013C3FFC2|nr:type II toxin-antitoxin system VapC family toxin [Gryllotalpicola protaetiae]